jgi:hypothetical protein
MLPFIILAAVNGYIFMNTGKKENKQEIEIEQVSVSQGDTAPKAEPVSETGNGETKEYTVYGTNWCGWTRKQLEYMESKKLQHKFVDCEKEKCEGMDGFPVTVTPTGERVVGFREF